jgi:hypothetical protein
MSFAQIETDYKPDFALGAYYQGINAANAKQLSEEEILKAFLNNQKEQNEQPLDLMIKQWQAAHAQDQMGSPEYRKSMLDGYMGQMNSQVAAGKKAMGTVDTEIPAINQENTNKLQIAKLLEQFRDTQVGQDQPQSSYEQPTPMQGDNGQMGFNFGSASNAVQNPDLTPQQKQLIMRDAQKRGENVLSTFAKPQQSGIENALVNTPEHLQKMELYKQTGENQANTAEIRGQYLLQAALARLQKPGEKPLTLDQAVARSQRILAGQEAGDKEAAEILITNARNYKLSSQAAAYNSSNMNLPATQQSGQVQNFPSAVQQAGALNIKGAAPSIIPSTNLPNGWKQVD